MVQLVKKYKIQIILEGIASLFFAAAFVGISLVLQNAIDDAIAGNVRHAICLSVSFVAVFAIVYGVQTIGEVCLNQKIMFELRHRITSRVLHKPLINFREYKETDYISLVQNDVKKIEDSYTRLVFSCVIAVAQLVFAIIVMTYYSWVFTVVMIGMTMLMFLVPAIFSKKLSIATENVSKAQEDLTEGLSEAMNGFSVANHFQRVEYRLGIFQRYNLGLKKASSKLGYLGQINGGISNVLAFSMQMVICILAGWFIYKGRMSYGSMVGVIQVSGSITTPLFQLFTWIPELKSLGPIMEKIEIYTTTNNYMDPCNDAKYDDKAAWKRIVLKNISFTYPGENKAVFSDLNLAIEKGKKYLLVGESGCGKTSLIELLTGSYSPDAGEILLDGEHLLSQCELQRMTSVVEQKVFLFNESIADNIQLGETDTIRLTQVLAQANLESVIEEKGVDFVVGSDGNQLSGGQKQRIAIARALYADRDILILDEGSSALDPETAFAIENRILEDADKTVIVISHHVIPKLCEKYDAIIYKKEHTFVTK